MKYYQGNHRRVWFTTLMLSVGVAGIALAQESVEKIEVTGSRLKRTDVEGVSSVIQIDEQAIERSGMSTVSELIKNMAVSSEGSYSTATVNENNVSVTKVNLRGLGAENTLILIDGQRVPDESGEGVVDLATIPIAAVERIDILKDSASAIYGSDATGGVINIITKKNFDGSAFSIRTSQPNGEGGQESSFSYLAGFNNEKMRMMMSLNYRKVEAVFHRDRDWTKIGLSSYSYPANYVEDKAGATLQKHSNCTAEEIQVGDNMVCSYNYGNTMAFSPKTTELGLLSNIEYSLNDKVSIVSMIRAVKNVNEWNMAPNAGEFTIPAAIAIANQDQLGLSGIEGDVKLRYRAIPWGLRTWEEENTLFGGNLGLKGSVGLWDWQGTVGRTVSKKTSISPSGFFLKDGLVRAIENGQFNPFETELSDSSLAVVNETAYQPFIVTDTEMNTFDLNASGLLFELPAGPVGLVIGANRIDQAYAKTIDKQTENFNTFGEPEDKSDSGDRSVNAVYAELGVPMLDNLEFQMAVRMDDYSDFGQTTNPKFGFLYRPVDRFLVRGNVATGFKAPTLRKLYQGTQVRLENLADKQTCGDPCDQLTTEVEIETEGNRNLKEETSLSYNLGIVSEPIDGFSIGMDYWYTKIDNIVRVMDSQKLLDAVYAGETIEGVEITRLGNTDEGQLERIKVPILNLGESEDAGIDLSLAYAMRLGSYGLSFGTDVSQKLFSREVDFPGATLTDTLDERGRPEWRMVSSAALNIASNQIFVIRNNRIAGTKTAQRDERIGEFSTFDTQYTWRHPWNGSITLGAINVLNTDFPVDSTERGGDDTRVDELYSANGRTLYVQMNQTF